MNSVKTLLELHKSKTGKVSDKWEAYFPAYERLFSPIRSEPIALLEIGVQNGGSLDVWGAYFPNATHIVGCDIDPKCADLWYDDPRINVVVGDANTTPALDAILAYCKTFDVVIDDGSHLSRDIISSFLGYFPFVKPGGLFIVEDTHALYRAVPGGGVLSKVSAHEFFKLCAELTNLEHWSAELHPRTLLSSFITDLPAWLNDGLIESVEFRNSMVILRKSAGRSELGRRLVCGSEASVNAGVLRHKSLASGMP